MSAEFNRKDVAAFLMIYYSLPGETDELPAIRRLLGCNPPNAHEVFVKRRLLPGGWFYKAFRDWEREHAPDHLARHFGKLRASDKTHNVVAESLPAWMADTEFVRPSSSRSATWRL